MSEGVQVDFFVNSNFVVVRVLLISEKKYVDCNLLPKSVTALRIFFFSIFHGTGTKVSPRVRRDFSAVERYNVVTAEVDFFPISWPWQFLLSAQFSLNGQAKVSKGNWLCLRSSDTCLSVYESSYHLNLMPKCCLDY